MKEQTITPQMIELAQAGDKGAMALIYQNYAPAIYGLLYRMVWQRETAQELMQDTFIDVLTNLSSYRAESGLYAWMRRIAVNRCLMHFRKHKAIEFEFTQVSEPRVTDTSDANIDTEALIKKLSSKRRMIVWLHEVEGMTHKEIAELMGKSLSFSKTEFSRAMQQLREFASQTDNSKKNRRSLSEFNKTLEPINEPNKEPNEVALCTPLMNNS